MRKIPMNDIWRLILIANIFPRDPLDHGVYALKNTLGDVHKLPQTVIKIYSSLASHLYSGSCHTSRCLCELVACDPHYSPFT